MKFIVGLSSLALISISSVSPCLAASQSISPSADQSLSNQSLPSAAKTIQVAGLFDSVTKVINTGEREQKRAQQRAASEKRRQERLERQENAARASEKRRQERLERQENAARERQERMEAYQKQQQQHAAAAAAKREQERKYFESLTPQQQKEYLAQRQARQEAALGVILTIFGAGMGGGDSAASPELSSSEEIWLRKREDRFNSRPEPQPAPAPVEPIGGNSGIHGDCHHAGCPR